MSGVSGTTQQLYLCCDVSGRFTDKSSLWLPIMITPKCCFAGHASRGASLNTFGAFQKVSKLWLGLGVVCAKTADATSGYMKLQTLLELPLNHTSVTCFENSRFCHETAQLVRPSHSTVPPP